MDFLIEPMRPTDWDEVRRIYLDGLATGHASFEVEAPTWEEWDQGHLPHTRLVARAAGRVLAWAALSPVSRRRCYAGVAEVSLYVSSEQRRRGVGKALLQATIAEAERNGIWTLQGGTFPENRASLRLQLGCGFRIIGRRERIAQRDGVWRDTIQTERRSGQEGKAKVRRPVIGVVGSGNDDSPGVSVAGRLGASIALEGWIVVCGGRDAGVMKAVTEAASRHGGLTVGILPDGKAEVAPGVDIAILTDLHNARNNVLTLSSDVVVACGIDGPGTASEVALALKNNKKVLLLGVGDPARAFFHSLGGNAIQSVATAEEAIQAIRSLLQHQAVSASPASPPS